MLHVLCGLDTSFVFDDTLPNKVFRMSSEDIAKRSDVFYDCLTLDDTCDGYFLATSFFETTEPTNEDLSKVTYDEYDDAYERGEFYFMDDDTTNEIIDKMYDKEVFDRTGIKVVSCDGYVLFMDCRQFDSSTPIRLSDYGTFWSVGSIRFFGESEHTIIIDDKVSCPSDSVFMSEGAYEVMYHKTTFKLENVNSSFQSAVDEFHKFWGNRVAVEEVC